ncbi:MAG: YvcK family protein [Tissierellia bacterium]|nr:YvcK family protein [Tissierellia bacterium]
MYNKHKSRLILMGWVFLGLLGVLLLSIGLSSFMYDIVIKYRTSIKVIFSIVGIFIISFSINKSFHSIINGVKKTNINGNISRSEINNIIYRERILSKGPKVVVIGGGTGLSVLLRGLKEYTSNITAIVTVADDGGGSGVLREDLGMLPPGDIRSCILALANTEPTMEKLLQYRFDEGILKGQNFGNLFLAAMNEIYGSFEMAIKETSNVLAVTGKVLPMTLEDVTLYAELENGYIIKGESEIPLKSKELSSKIKKVYMEPTVSYPLIEAVVAIKEADIIVLGPGSLYTSVIPNLLVNNIVDTIYEAKGTKVYITNVMTQPGETEGYTALDHVDSILKHSKEDFLDYCIVNVQEIPEETLKKYTFDGSEPVILGDKDEETLNSKGIKLIKGNLIDIKKDYIRHDALELSRILIEMAKKKA